jgi:hypothetical protein
MESYMLSLLIEARNDPVTTLNIILATLSFISLSRLIADLFGELCRNNKQNELERTLERMEQYLVAIHYNTSYYTQEQEQQQEQPQEQDQDQSQDQASETGSQESQDEASDTDSQQSQDEASDADSQQSQDEVSDTDSQQRQEQEQPVSQKKSESSDKHQQLIALLKDGDELMLTYKKQNFSGKFKLKKNSQHGYVIVDGKVEYNTPSHFSSEKKLTVNPTIRSDNGWDTVYVIRNKKKFSLNDLINT